MKKIVLAFDGFHFSEGAFEFARKLNELSPVLLTGVFLPQEAVSPVYNYSFGAGTYYIPATEEKIIDETIEHNIQRFEDLCLDNKIEYRIHKDISDFIIPGLKKESRFADLMIIGSEKFYQNSDAKTPGAYLLDTLHEVACSVIVVPEQFDFPQSIILAYDGSDDSVFAIKQFAYLFPELTAKPALLVYANDENKAEIPDRVEMEELVSRHFSELTIFKLNLSHKKFFSTWISEEKSAMLVSGSYGRSGISQLFKKSFISDVITDHCLPVFIAHK